MSRPAEWERVRGALELAHRARTAVGSDLDGLVVHLREQGSAAWRDTLDEFGISVLDDRELYVLLVGMAILTRFHARFAEIFGQRANANLVLELTLAHLSEYLPKP